MVVWVLLEVWLAAKVMPWNSELTKGALVWFITAGLVLLGRFEEASKNRHFFRHKAIQTLTWPALAEFYLNVYPLPLLAEIALQPVLAVLVTLSILAARDESLRWAKGCAERLLSFIGLALFGYVMFQTIRGWGTLNKQGLFLEFALPVWLTIGALPFIFLLATYGAYEMAFLRLRFTDSGRVRPVRTRLALIIGLHFRPREIAAIRPNWLRRVATAPTFRAALTVVREYQAQRRREDLRVIQDKERLKKFAGVTGVDSDNRQLDRREFRETTEALRFVSLCMMGWYRRGGRYRPDILTILEGSFERHGLKGPPEIHVHVSSDGQAWYAWRRTVTGWCFAIGAGGPPPNQWLYDGSEPPVGFPGVGPSWGTSRLSSEASPNWEETEYDDADDE
jgi:hypothetical protein